MNLMFSTDIGKFRINTFPDWTRVKKSYWEYAVSTYTNNHRIRHETE